VFASTVCKLRDVGLSGVILSLDSADPLLHDSLRGRKGSHDSCLETARLFRRTGIPVRVSTVLLRQNYDSLDRIIHLADSVGARAIEFKRLRPVGNARDVSNLALDETQEDTLYEYFSKLKERSAIEISLVYGEQPVAGIDSGCPCGKTVLCILGNGDIAPCVYNPKVIGNALKDTITAIWCSSKELDFLRKHFCCQGLEKMHD
jgi:MoaA/NifB/PqqE/SkfB family radical SAM enzyme